MSDIFLSYKSEDRAKAQIIAEALERNGYSVWWDRVIPPGRIFAEVIEEELAAAKCLVVLWSKESVKSEWVNSEASEGKRRNILIPVLIEDVKLPLAFNQRQTANLIDWDGTLPNPEFDLFLGSVSRMLGKVPVLETEIQKTGDQAEEERKKTEINKQEEESAEKEEEDRIQKEQRKGTIKETMQEKIHSIMKRKGSKEMIIAMVLIFSILLVGYWVFPNEETPIPAPSTPSPIPIPIVNDSNNGGGVVGTSDEDFKNILVSETEREYVNKDSKVSYSFDLEGNIIRYINFTGKTSSGRIAAKIDILKNTSTLVDHAPPGKVFKNMGIYVGNLGWASPNNIANPTISFIVHKSWVNENKIDKSTITLNRYSDGKWNPLETDLINEDQNSLYFESKTPGFSQFAVTGTEASAARGGEGEDVGTGIRGFTLLTDFTIMLVVVQLLRRKK